MRCSLLAISPMLPWVSVFRAESAASQITALNWDLVVPRESTKVAFCVEAPKIRPTAIRELLCKSRTASWELTLLHEEEEEEKGDDGQIGKLQ